MGEREGQSTKTIFRFSWHCSNIPDEADQSGVHAGRPHPGADADPVPRGGGDEGDEDDDAGGGAGDAQA